VDSIRFTVLGIPQSGGSKTPLRNPQTGKMFVKDSNPRARDWKAAVRTAARTVYDGPLLAGPLLLRVTFYLPRPKSHYRTGRHAAALRDDAPIWHTTRPDATKLLRPLEDGLTQVLWIDDAMVACQEIEKRYTGDGEPARAEVGVRLLASES